MEKMEKKLKGKRGRRKISMKMKSSRFVPANLVKVPLLEPRAYVLCFQPTSRNAHAARVRNIHYASGRSLVSLRIRRTSRVIRTLLVRPECKSLRSFSRELRESGARLRAGRLCTLPRHVFCIPVAIFVRRPATGWSTTRFERDIAMPAA